MKTTSSSPPPSPFGGALNKSNNIYLTILCLIIATLWNTHSVSAAPAKTDLLDSTFPLDLQPPIFEATASSASPSQPNGNSEGTAIDSYGNPIESLQPIETPDGRKVVSAQGLQFEIPNYASGITELKKPADDLLPPFVDPIVVALPSESAETFNSNAGPNLSAEKTYVDVQNAGIFKGLPDYILELNDPDIAGPVDYEPADDGRGLKVIAWDLVPPLTAQESEVEKAFSHSNKFSHTFSAQASQASSHTTSRPQFGSRGSFEAQTTRSTTPRTTTTRRTTTTTPRTTTTPKTTTTPRITTTPRTTTTTTPRTTTTTTTTTPEPDPSEFLRLEAGDSYTLPPWLQDIDDPDLDVAVAYIEPEDLKEYNQTIDRDILPPLEPYTDLNNLHITPPPNYKVDRATTPRTTTTRRTTTPRTTTTTTTTTKRPTVSTYQPHWIRAKPTSAKPTIATFNNQFTSLSPSIQSSNFAQRTTSTTSTTTTVKPKTTTNYYNQALSTTTSSTDKIGSSSEETPAKQKNPFLPSFDDGKYRPNKVTTTRKTTTTTTTTTPAPEIVEDNPFEPTIPPWLKDFDYPDLAPGVPFVYDPNEDENPVDKNILPPSKTDESDNSKPNSDPSSNSPFSNSQKPQGFTNKFTSSAISLASSSSIPSIVTIPLPSTQTNQAVSTVTRPPPVFVPPPATTADGLIIADTADDLTIKTSSTFNTNFAAPFEPTTVSTTAATTVSGADQKKVPLSADRESFPPFNNVITGSSTLPSKTTFTKSEDGKVITNNIFLSGSLGSTSAKPLGSSFEKNTFSTGSSSTKTTTASTVFKQFGTTSSAASGFVTSPAASTTFSSISTNDGTKYTGRFGGPPGVLAPQSSGFTTSSSTTVTQSFNKPTFTTFGITSSPGLATNNKDKFTGSFGGPPGILKPYDNIKNR